MKLHIPIAIFLGIAVVACCSTGCASQAPKTVKIWLRSSETKIRDTVLKYTPLGSSQKEVLSFIEAQLRHVDTAMIWPKNGALKRTNQLSSKDSSKVGRSKVERSEQIIGVKSISVEIGWYPTILPLIPVATNVYVYWAFDGNDCLIDVIVYKKVDKIWAS